VIACCALHNFIRINNGAEQWLEQVDSNIDQKISSTIFQVEMCTIEATSNISMSAELSVMQKGINLLKQSGKTASNVCSVIEEVVLDTRLYFIYSATPCLQK
jgi:hypothetical protein